MMNKLLSVIVPTYNMENYLHRCLDSLIVTEKNMQLLEVLVVNDGSKDCSSAIAHEYALKYPQTFCVIDKENGNYGSCVNRGLKEITGKYVRILDADDFYQTSNLDAFIDALKRTDTDLVLSDMVSCYAGGKHIKQSFDFDPGVIYDTELMGQSEFMDKMEMHVVTYKKEILDRMAYWQTEGISYTDQEWIFYPMAYVNSINYISLVIYQYMLDRTGQTMDIEVEKNNVGHKIMILSRMIHDVSSTEYDHPSKEIYMKCRLGKLLRLVYKLVLLYQTEEQFHAHLEPLAVLDKKVKSDMPDLYKETNDYIISSEIPLKFVRYWRKMGNRYPDWVLMLHRQLKKLDLFLRKNHLRG